MIINTVYVNGDGKAGTSKIEVTIADAVSVYTTDQTGKRRDASLKDGKWIVRNCPVGEYTITARKANGEVATKQLTIAEENQQLVYRVTMAFVTIYGIQRDIKNPSSAWTRTDNAVGFTATASVGTIAGHSDFDNCYPWSGIHRETLSTGDVMVKIPKFWFKRWRDGNIEHIQIADKAKEGFNLHPAFFHASNPKECIYVGAYKTSSYNKSVTGAKPQVSQTRATMRTNAKAKGTGWGLIDIATLSAIQMLMLVEFADNNVQNKIGRGYCDGNSASANVGSCNNVPNLTGIPAGANGKIDVVWRGIEGLWGNAWEWCDGVNSNNGTYYVCNDPSKYADNTDTGYDSLSFAGSSSWSSSYITEEGLDTGNNTHVMLPSAAGSGSESTYHADACWCNAGWRVFRISSRWDNGSHCGIFTSSFGYNSYEEAGVSNSSRLIYIPS